MAGAVTPAAARRPRSMIAPMRRRHLRGRCCASRSRCTRARGATRCSCASSRCRGTAVVLRRPGRARRRRLRAGSCSTADDGHVTTIAVDPDLAPPRDRHPPAARARRARRSTGRENLTLEVRMSQRRRPGALPPVRVRPGRRAQELLRRDRTRTRSSCGRTTIDTARVRGAPRRHRGAASPATTLRSSRCTTRLTAASTERTILGIETSCDETAAAVVDDGRDVLSSVVSSQVDLHARFGGVVPEIASRAHVELIGPVIAEALGRGGRRRLDEARRGRGVSRAGPRRARCSSACSAAKALALVAGTSRTSASTTSRRTCYAALARGARPRAPARRC